MRTLDETIKFEELIVESCESTARLCAFNDPYEPDVVFENNKCAEKHKQIVEWLKELKRLREQEDVLDKIREEIESNYGNCDICVYDEDYDYEENNISEYIYVGSVAEILEIIDKYKVERGVSND